MNPSLALSRIIDELFERVDINLYDVNTRFLQHFFGHGVCVSRRVKDATYSCVDNHLGTYGTGQVGTEKGCTLYGNTMISGLNDRILFGMYPSTKLMIFSGGDIQFLPEAPCFKAVFNAGGRTVVSGGQDSFVFYDDGADRSPETCGTPGHQRRDVHKIGFPRRSAASLCHFYSTSLCQF